MAEKITQMKEPASFTSLLSVQRKCADCEEEENLQRKSSGDGSGSVDASLERYIGGLSTSGQELPRELRNFYEPRFGHDFSQVKIHSDNQAAESAQSRAAQEQDRRRHP